MGVIDVITILCCFIVFYMFFVRPMKEKQKKQDEFMNNLKNGDDIVLISGLCCKFCDGDDSVIFVEVDESKRRLKFLKSAISIEETIKFREEKRSLEQNEKK